jgi:hypothetical protein
MNFAVEHSSLVTCPVCGDQRVQPIPEFSCLLSYTCPVCSTVLRPAAADCCIFCTYGSVPCPAIQEERWRRTGSDSIAIHRKGRDDD